MYEFFSFCVKMIDKEGNDMKKIVLIDGNSLMFRSYYATAYTGNLMKNKQGLYTNALFGFCNMLSKILEDEMDAIFVAFDAGKQTFRHQAYEEYKGGRKPMPEEFRMQIPYIKQYLDLLNIRHEEMLLYEADDLLATVATLALQEGYEDIRIITGDKDLLQMVHDSIRVFLTKKGVGELEEYNEDNFKEKMGFFSWQIPDYKGLVGDTSDNLPGIKGIGEKTACKLLEDFKTLEKIVENAGLLKGKTQTLVQEGAKIGLECKSLATLKKDIDLPFTLNDLQRKEPSYDELMIFFKEMEFYSLLKRMDKTHSKTEGQKEKSLISYKIVDEKYDFSSFQESFIIPEVFKTNEYRGSFLGLGMMDQNHQVFIPLECMMKNESLHAYLKGDYPKNTFDAKKLYVVLKRYDMMIQNIVFDALLAVYLVQPAFASDDVKRSLEHFISTSLEYEENIYGAHSKMNIPTIEIYSHYSIEKCLAVYESKEVLLEKLKEKNQEFLFQKEIELSFVLGDMELDGLKVDRQKLNQVQIDLTQKMEEKAHQIYEIAQEEFNINSVKKLGEILFEKLKLPSGKKNKTGYSTSSDVLEKLAPTYEIAKYILEYRAISKLLSTYILGLYEVMDEDDFVHPIYKQALTLTGRLSSVEPNIQNMPIRTEIGQVIREAFVSRFDGGSILSCDYSQIELRVLAHLSNDEKMISSFQSGEDFHKQTASWLYDVPLEEVTKEMRRTAKAINFGIVYGMSAWGLSESVNITPQEANNYIQKYFTTHHQIRTFLDETIENAKKNGYTETLYHRIRYIPELTSSNHTLYGFGERTAMNSPIQGTAADIIKLAMVEVKKQMKGMKSILIAQVHDELVFDVYPNELEKLTSLVQKVMEEIVALKVPLLVGCSSGENWLKS